MESKVYEEVGSLADRMKGVEGVLSIILFGSYSRGNYDEGSDIDLLVIFKNKRALRRNQEKIYEITAKTDLFIQAITLTLKELKSSPLFKTVLREGKIYHATEEIGRLFATVHRPYALITYTITNLKEKEKITFIQRLEGRRVGRYAYNGLLQEAGGYKVGKGALIVPLENLNKITQYLEENNVDYVIRYVWI